MAGQQSGRVALGIVNEPADWAMTFYGWTQGDYSHLDWLGLLPFVPAVARSSVDSIADIARYGDGVGDIARHGDDVGGIGRHGDEGAGYADDNIPLWRAVQPGELSDLQELNRFRNPPGIETKYFSSTEDGARNYGSMAEAAFGDGPYSIVETSISQSRLSPNMFVQVDGNIPAVVIPEKILSYLSPPKLLGR